MSDFTLDAQKEKLISLQNQLNYVNNQLEKDLEDWERKEYEGLKSNYEESITRLSLHIDYIEELFYS